MDRGFTLDGWMLENGIALRGAWALKVLCIALNDVPAKTNALEVFNLVTAPELTGGRQFRDPNKWWALAVERISSRPGCEVITGAEVTGVFESGSDGGGGAGGVVVFGELRPADRVVLCTQATGLVPVLRGTPFERNWSMVTREWAEATAYYSFGFQLHFASRVREPRGWCWACAGPWTVIVLSVGDWLDEPSAVPGIAEVWSCCVVDTSAPSPFVQDKSADQIPDYNLVLNECLRQIRESSGTPVTPKYVTFSPGLHHDGARWVSAETGFTSGARDRVPIKGRAPNLFAVGCFSESDRPVTANFGSAIDAVLRYLDMHDRGVARFGRPRRAARGGCAALSAASLTVAVVCLFAGLAITSAIAWSVIGRGLL